MKGLNSLLIIVVVLIGTIVNILLIKLVYSNSFGN